MKSVKNMSAEELIQLAEEKKQEEAAREEEQAQVREEIEGLQSQLAEAEANLETVRKEAQGTVAKARESVTEIKNQIRELERSLGVKGTKSEGFGDAKAEDVIVSVLKNTDGPLRPSQIRDRILADGAYNGKQTSLSSTINAALAKLVEENTVVKNELSPKRSTYALAA